jgi:hypothetical protein
MQPLIIPAAPSVGRTGPGALEAGYYAELARILRRSLPKSREPPECVENFFCEVRMAPVRHRKDSLVPTVPSPDNTSGRGIMALTNQVYRTEAQGSMYDVRRGATQGGPCFGAQRGAEKQVWVRRHD